MKGRREDIRDEGFKAPGQDVSNTNIMKMFNAQILDAHIAPLTTTSFSACSPTHAP